MQQAGRNRRLIPQLWYPDHENLLHETVLQLHAHPRAAGAERTSAAVPSPATNCDRRLMLPSAPVIRVAPCSTAAPGWSASIRRRSRGRAQGRSSGVNFALPVDLVRTIVPNLIVYGNALGKGRQVTSGGTLDYGI